MPKKANQEEWARQIIHTIAELEIKLAAAEASEGRLRAALEEVEWVGPGPHCPWCGWIKPGHLPNCPRQLALRPAATQPDCDHPSREGGVYLNCGAAESEEK